MLELYFINHEKKAIYRFGKADNLPGLLDILQFVLDSCASGLDGVVIIDPARPDKVASAARVAARYGMRRRSFDEKMNNVTTYNLEV